MTESIENEFEGMRPYRDDEIPAAMSRIAADEHFPLLAGFVFPELTISECADYIRGFKTVNDFQVGVMKRVNERIIASSAASLTCEGIDLLDPSCRYLFVSNHRDIMLDACFLQYCLYLHGHETTEITFGSNLMGLQIVDDIGRSNKMFRVERGGSMREFYKSSLLLSKYIRYCIGPKRQSVWIAQRNGRTKDGLDKTEPGLMKMFTLSAPKLHPAEALAELNIVPMSISYEWEPCDALKAAELYQSQSGPYVKKPGEDLNSILTGIRSPKGRVQIGLSAPLALKDFAPVAKLDSAAFMAAAARIVDERIRATYRLFPNNFIAADLLSGSEAHSDRYSPEEKEAFLSHLECINAYPAPQRPGLRELMLGIYANPLVS